MKGIKFSETIENVLLCGVGIVCLLIPILDFVGVFDNVEWFKARLPIFTLLALGSLTTYLVSHLNNNKARALERQKELLQNIKLDDSSARFKTLLENLWQKRERDIDKLFSQVDLKTKQGVSLADFLKTAFDEIIGGNYFGARVVLPWDFTLCALNYEGVIIWHPGIPKGHRLDEGPAHFAVKERNGTTFWENDLCSEQLASIFPNRAPGNKRFTKVYYRDFPDLKAVVVFESHINIIDKLPAIKLQERGGNSVTNTGVS